MDSDILAALMSQPYIDPRPRPLPPPEVAWNAAPLRCLVVSAEWSAHLIGVLERLLEWDAWQGTDEQIFSAIQAMEEILSQLSTPYEP